MATNLFTKARAKAAVSTSKSNDEKIRVEVDNEGLFDMIKEYEQLNDTLKSTQAKADMIHSQLKDIGKDEWVKLFTNIGKNPNSFFVEQKNSDDTGRFMVIPMDRYITVSESRAEELREQYGDEIVTEETTFEFDSAMIEKYGEVLARLIEESEEIDDRDKEKIIKAKVKIGITKGTIDKMDKYGDVGMVVEDIKPVISLKNIEVVKG
jgi:hypothetical protein